MDNIRNLNITIVNRHRADTLGGSEIQCDFIATELVKRGYNVNYVAPEGDQEQYDTSYRVFPCRRESEDIANKVLETRPSIVYWRFNKHLFYSTVKKIKGEGIPVIFAASSVNDVDPWFFKKEVGIRKKVKKLLLSHLNHRGFRFIDALTVNNKEYLNRLKTPIQEFIPNGMKSEYVAFNWPRPYCAWISSLKQIKRPEKMVALAKEFSNSGFDFLMIGEVQENHYQWMKEPDNLPDNLHYLGTKTPEEVNGILKTARLHIHTCYPEGFPNVFIQAWMQATPSVSLGFDPSNYIEEYKMGYHAKENWDNFLNAIEELLQNEEKAALQGKNAKNFAESLFRIEKSVDDLENVINQLL